MRFTRPALLLVRRVSAESSSASRRRFTPALMLRSKSTQVLSSLLAALLAWFVPLGLWADEQNPRTSQGREQASFAPPAKAAKFAPDRLLVRFRAGTPKLRTEAAHAAVKALVVRSFKAVRDLELVRLPEAVRVEAALTAYRKDPSVLYAEPDYAVHALQNPVTPNDPRFAEQWGLHNTGQNGGTPGADIHAPEAWGLSTGSTNVVVGVIDSGIDYNHEDLSANMFRNPLDCNNNGIDDDGNGFIDDCYGIDAANNDSDPMDDHGHGTHVAGTIGAAGNNGVGVVGVNWQVKLIACKFLDAEGSGFTSGAITCLEYLAAMKDRGVNIVASNNSWGGDAFSQALLDAIDSHRQHSILFIAAAGNARSDNDTFAFYPAGYNLLNVIAVSATTSSDTLSSFSNFGRRSVHVAAPGSAILSTLPGNGYELKSGTSMAAPHVTGVAALLKAQDPTRDWKAIRNLILAGGDTIPALAQTISGKRLNAHGAMACTNSTVLSRLQPRTNIVTSAPGLMMEPVDLAVLHIKCGTPNGNVTVLVDGGAETVTLLDDGQGTDQEAGDGIYSGQWMPPSTMGIGIHTLTIPNAQSDNVFTVEVLSPYKFSTDVGFNYRNNIGTNLLMGDDSSRQITPDFPILFGGGSFDSLFVNSNGNISFTNSFFGFFNQPVPTPRTPTLVAPFWDDLWPNGEQNVYWGVTGTAPNRELVIEWRGVEHFLSFFGVCMPSVPPAGVTFQIVFFEGSSDILFNYKDVIFGPYDPNNPDYSICYEPVDAGGSASVGVQIASQVGTQFSFNTPALADGTAILWTLGIPTPTITRLSPFTAAAGDPGIILQLFGTNFLPQSDVKWNGNSRPTTFVSSSLLKADLAVSDLAAPATVQVIVSSPEPGGSSNQLPFTIYGSYPTPLLASLDPSMVLANEPSDFTLTVTGTDFVSSSVVRWNGADRPTTVLSSTKAQALIPASDRATAGTAQVTVFTPSPGGGTSNSLTIAIDNPVPHICCTPIIESPGGPDFTAVWEGGGFVSSTVLRWNGADRPTTVLSNTQLRATIFASDIAREGRAAIAAFNPPPGGGTTATPVWIAPPAPNDDFANSIVISSSPFTRVLDIRRATVSPTDPIPSCLPPWDQQSLWFSFSVPAPGATITVDTIGSFGPFGISAWTGAPGSFTEVACDDNGAWDGSPYDSSPDYYQQARLRLTRAPGTIVHFMVTTDRPYRAEALVLNAVILVPEQPLVSLTVGRAGSGTGTISSNPAGIYCGGTCSAVFTSGTVVSLTATSASGSVFSGWGGACSGSGTCSVTMDAAKNITATFDAVPPFDFGAPPASKTITAGQSAQFTLEMVGQPGFAGTVSFSCTSGVPQAAACSFNPPSVSPGGSAATTTLTIATTAPTTAELPADSRALFALWLSLPALAIAGVGARGRGALRRTMLGLIWTALILGAGMAGCSGGGGSGNPPRPGTPPGTYNVTVTGTSGAITRSTTVTLVVQ